VTQIAQLLDGVMNECNFRAKGNYANATSQDERQVFRLANRARSSILRYPWAKLRRFGELTLTTDTVYNLPADFHGLIPDTPRTNSRVLPVDVNTDPAIWSWLNTRQSMAGAQYRTRWFRDRVEFYRPRAGDVVRYEYWSSHPINDIGGSSKEKFTADSDEWMLDDDLLTWQIIWRFKKAKGIEDWQFDQIEANAYMKEFMGRQDPPKTVNLAGGNDWLAGEPHTDLWLD
jgi:hypothetical protein